MVQNRAQLQTYFRAYPFCIPKIALADTILFVKIFPKKLYKIIFLNFPKVIHIQRISRVFQDFQVFGHPVRIRVSENARCRIHLRTMKPLNYRHAAIP